jgi:hypothetical protein
MSAPTKAEQIEEFMQNIDATPEDCLQVGMGNMAAWLNSQNPRQHTILVVLSCDNPKNYEELCELALKLKMMVEHTPFKAEVRP